MPRESRETVLRAIGRLSLILGLTGVTVGLTAGAGSKAEWNVKSALRQIDKANKSLRSVQAEAHFAEVINFRPVNGAATLYTRFDRRARAEIGGDNPRTVLWLATRIYVHELDENEVRVYDQFSNPEILGQYAVLGFFPSGSGLKKDYKVELVGEEDLDGRIVLFFLLTPKSKEVGRAISRIELRIDTQTWLPAQQTIHHVGGQIKLTVNYSEVTRDGDLPASLFRPDWPADAKSIQQ